MKKKWNKVELNPLTLSLQATALTSNCSYLAKAKSKRAFGQMSGDSNIKSIQKNKVLGSTRNQKYFEFFFHKNFKMWKREDGEKFSKPNWKFNILIFFFFFFFIKKLIFFLQRWRLLKKTFLLGTLFSCDLYYKNSR